MEFIAWIIMSEASGSNTKTYFLGVKILVLELFEIKREKKMNSQISGVLVFDLCMSNKNDYLLLE